MEKNDQNQGLPEGWIESTLRDMLETIEAGLRPKGGVTRDSGEIPSFGGENIKLNGGVIYDPVKKISKRFFHQLSKGKLENNDVLINKDGANTGKVGLYQNKYYNLAAINEHVFLLRGKNTRLNNIFLYYYLLSPRGRKQLKDQITGSAQPGLNTEFVSRILLVFPENQVEQEKIAEILSTCDDSIEKSEARIDKLKQIKQGLMQDLFRYGIDENGNVRRDETHKFKDSPLGRIPESWDVFTLNTAAEIVFGQSPPGSSYNNEGKGLPLINGPVEFGPKCPIKIQWTTQYTKLCRPNDILFCVRGSTTGRMNRANDVYCIGRGVAAIRGKAGKSITQFIELTLIRLQDQVLSEARGSGSTFPQVTSSKLQALNVALPELEEQSRIASVLSAADEAIQEEEAYKNKLISIKHGLMDDLLSGKVRVNHLLKGNKHEQKDIAE